MLKVFNSPSFSECLTNPDNGIKQLIANLYKALPEFGYELTDNPDNPDIVLNHAASGNKDCDVLYCHGLYPTYKLDEPMYYQINAGVIHNAQMAKQVIVPSEWVADLFRRDMHLNPHVIHHGVDIEAWKNDQPNGGYVIWNKGRGSDVCTTEWVIKLAQANPHIRFVSTFGAELPNMTLTGVVAHAQMMQLVKGANVYLATTFESGDIGSREALAAGIPVLGFNHGAIRDFVTHGYNGYLATRGDFDSLNQGLAWVLRNRDKLSKNAIESAKVFSWRNTAKQVASVFEQALKPKPKIKVSVIIPHYRYYEFLHEAVSSVIEQKTNFQYEIIVIDDCSPDLPEPKFWERFTDTYDNCLAAIGSYIVVEKGRDNCTDIIVRSMKENSGVANTRNYGISLAKGDYIVCLDADDRMGDNFLQICADELDKDRTTGIVYTRLQTDNGFISRWLEGNFSFTEQLKGNNQIPSLCMFRKAAWERNGGFRTRYTPAEDADLWTRITTFGYKAKKVSDQPLFIYRYHENSLSAPYRGDNGQMPKAMPNWYGDKGYFKNMPFAAPDAKISHPVRNYDNPDVSIIIPVSDKHKYIVCDAIDSVEQQTYWNWQVIVVNNTDDSLDYLKQAYPFIQLVDCQTKSAAVARNMGLEHASAPLTVFLDADDYLYPEFLSKTIRAYKENGGSYIYTDWTKLSNGQTETYNTPNFDLQTVWTKGSFHAVTALVPTKEAKFIRFDESLPSWEDYTFFLKLIVHGICGKRLAEPLFVYRIDTGELRERGAAMSDQLKPVIYQQFKDYIEGIKQVACSCKSQTSSLSPEEMAELVKVTYSGVNIRSGAIMNGSHEVRGDLTGTRYGRRQAGEIFYVKKQDALHRPDLFTPLVELELEREQQLIPADL